MQKYILNSTCQCIYCERRLQNSGDLRQKQNETKISIQKLQTENW